MHTYAERHAHTRLHAAATLARHINPPTVPQVLKNRIIRDTASQTVISIFSQYHLKRLPRERDEM